MNIKDIKITLDEIEDLIASYNETYSEIITKATIISRATKQCLYQSEETLI